jgi:hypothetical protein
MKVGGASATHLIRRLLDHVKQKSDNPIFSRAAINMACEHGELVFSRGSTSPPHKPSRRKKGRYGFCDGCL